MPATVGVLNGLNRTARGACSTTSRCCRGLSDFAGMCWYHQTSPDSHFTRNRVCSLATPHGRVTLSGMRLIITSNGRKEEQVLAAEADWHAALRDHFGIVFGQEAPEQ